MKSEDWKRAASEPVEPAHQYKWVKVTFYDDDYGDRLCGYFASPTGLPFPDQPQVGDWLIAKGREGKSTMIPNDRGL
jgi:hypothetical protein